jgi:hypothetical protein
MNKLIFDSKYTWQGLFGCWFYSSENVELGEVRCVRGKLFYVYSIHGGWKWEFIAPIWSPKKVNWVAVGGSYEMEDIRKFRDVILQQ